MTVATVLFLDPKLQGGIERLQKNIVEVYKRNYLQEDHSFFSAFENKGTMQKNTDPISFFGFNSTVTTRSKVCNKK